MGKFKPDEEKFHPDGSKTQRRWRRKNPGEEKASIRKEISIDGKVKEVWHEVFDKEGNLIHSHQKPVRGSDCT
jgi:hypothetical protein